MRGQLDGVLIPSRTHVGLCKMTNTRRVEASGVWLSSSHGIGCWGRPTAPPTFIRHQESSVDWRWRGIVHRVWAMLGNSRGPVFGSTAPHHCFVFPLETIFSSHFPHDTCVLHHRIRQDEQEGRAKGQQEEDVSEILMNAFDLFIGCSFGAHVVRRSYPRATHIFFHALLAVSSKVV